MASEVQICNVALANIGDSATVASIDPPEGSAQAEHCSRFYPIARDTILEDPTVDWNFATKRSRPAQLSSGGNSKWLYAYALPSDCIRVISITAADATDDQIDDSSLRMGERFVTESLSSGQVVLRTNIESAELRYIYRATDPSKFSNSFTMAVTWRLSSLLSGPVIKGDAGRKMAQFSEGMSREWLGKAAQVSGNQSFTEMGMGGTGYMPPHLSNR